MAGEPVPVITEALFISRNTVRNHRKAIYRKVDVSSQSDLIALGSSLGSTPGGRREKRSQRVSPHFPLRGKFKLSIPNPRECLLNQAHQDFELT